MKTLLLKALFLSILSLAVFGFFAGCSENENSDSDDNDAQSDDDLGDPDHKGLERCQNCDDVLNWVRLAAKVDMNRQLDQNLEDTLNGGWYWTDDDWLDDDSDWEGDDDAADDAADDATDDADDDAAADDETGDSDDSDDDHSDTTTQEEGVDEADIVKTDGDTLFLLAGGNLMVFDPTPAGETHELSRLEIVGSPIEMFIYGRLVVIFSRTWSYDLPEDVWPEIPHEQLAYEILVTTIVDVSDLADPQITRTTYFEGSYISSRRIANLTRIVSGAWLPGPQLNYWVDPTPYILGDGTIDEAGLRSAYDVLRAENEALINLYPLDQWIPKFYQIDDYGTSTGYMSPCENYYHPVTPMGWNSSIVTTIDLDTLAAHTYNIGLLAAGQMIYASTEALYMAGDANTYYYWYDPQDQESMIHKFTLSEDGPVEYTGSGAIKGYVLNQYSMGEYNGYLRVASTIGWWGEELKNFVTVLAQGDGELTVAGQINDIAVGEQLKSARFVGDRGYLVTFVQTDPLFTVDLADPANPQIIGSLIVPGFSTFIVPFDDNHILTIGENGTEDTATGGVALSLFDISDFANPTLQYRESVVEGWDAYSPALYDPKAFLYYPEKNLVSVPVYEYNYDWGDDDWTDDDVWTDDDAVDDDGKADDDDTAVPPDDDIDDDLADDDDDNSGETSGAYIYTITAEDGFQLLGFVDHTGLAAEEQTYYYPMTVLRSVVIGDYLYTISGAALVVSELPGLGTLVTDDLPYESDYWWGDDDWEDGGEGDWN